MRQRWVPTQKLSCLPALAVLSIVAGVLSSCGSGSSQAGSPVAKADFTLSLDSTALVVAQSSSVNFTVSLGATNGFNSTVSISIGGLPAQVTASPASFTLSPGGSQTVVLKASATATVQDSAFSVTGTAGSLTHAQAPTLNVVTGNANFRIRYFDTALDLISLTNQPMVLYHSPTKRFFLSNAAQNQVVVYDTNTESQTGVISVPGAWSVDQSADQSLLYVGTLIGDIYVIDPVGLTVKQHIEPSTIGPNGFYPNAVIALAGGNFALLGTESSAAQVIAGSGGGSGSGYSSLGIWNPATNSLALYTTSAWASNSGASGVTITGQTTCGSLQTFLYLLPSPDRTQLITGDGGNTVCRFNPATSQAGTIALAKSGNTQVLQTPDGSTLLTVLGSTVNVYNESNLQPEDQFVLNSPTNNGAILSADGNTLYVVEGGEGLALAYNWKTHALLGWASTPVQKSTAYGDLEPFAIDGTGLMAGVQGSGLGFADMGSLQTGTPEPFTTSPSVSPNVGPSAGGTAVTVGIATTGNETLANVFFGTLPATNPTANSSGITATTPAHAAGPVDVIVSTAGGGLALSANGFSYGPSIQQLLGSLSTAEGGGTATVFGYGLFTSASSAPSDVHVSVGGQSATVTSGNNLVSSDGNQLALQSIQFTLPAGAAQSKANLQISNSGGSTSLASAVTYLPATQQFPLSGAQLYQGIYDSHRNLYYFTDASEIRVFSKAQGAWLSPIAIPLPGGATSQRLLGISLSPNGSNLAVSDAANHVIYFLNPSTPGSVRTFPVTGGTANTGPSGIAVSDSGVVYFTVWGSLFKLATVSGVTTQNTGYHSNTPDNEAFLLLTQDNKSVFLADGWALYKIDTASDSVEQGLGQYFYPNRAVQANHELALSANETSVLGGRWLFAASSLHLNAPIQLDTLWGGQNLLYGEGRPTVSGSKFSADGNLLFAPEANAINVINASTGLPVEQVALPFALSSNFDALVSDNTDFVVFCLFRVFRVFRG